MFVRVANLNNEGCLALVNTRMIVTLHESTLVMQESTRLNDKIPYWMIVFEHGGNLAVSVEDFEKIMKVIEKEDGLL